MRLRSATELREESIRRDQKDEQDYYLEHKAVIDADYERAVKEIEAAQAKKKSACYVIPELNRHVVIALGKAGYLTADLLDTNDSPRQTYINWS